jgi:hypothetical protein
MNDVKIDVKSRPVEVEYDRGRDWRARIGFVLIPTDGIIEGEMTQYAPPRCRDAFHPASRVRRYNRGEFA